MNSGDGWTHCAQGHRHWGLFGAAGLLVTDGERVILQHRAPWTHEGDTWGIPGGARDSHESAVEAAVREAGEEAGLRACDVIPVGLYIDDHGGWSYTTVLARPVGELEPRAANTESVAMQWVASSAVAGLHLHSGFATSWPLVSALPESLHLVVAPHLAQSAWLNKFSQHGIAARRLPGRAYTGTLTRLIPDVHFSEGPSAAEFVATHAANGRVVLVLEERDLEILD